MDILNNKIKNVTCLISGSLLMATAFAGKLWTEVENDAIINNPDSSDRVLSQLFQLKSNGRSERAIRTQRLSLAKKYPDRNLLKRDACQSWGSEEDQIIIDYGAEETDAELTRRLSGRTEEAIRNRRFILDKKYPGNNLRKRDVYQPWKDEEDQIIIDNGAEMTDAELAIMLNRSEEGIRNQRLWLAEQYHALNLRRRDVYRPWGKEENQVIIDHGAKMTAAKLCRQLPGRTEVAIRNQRRLLAKDHPDIRYQKKN
ncbi:MAG: hypothetical protein LBS71_00290 [Puniceicoccales bacterium]|jgi:hypothetical protein|nr:hypothetical protein [Puniceicoccales bacterium]